MEDILKFLLIAGILIIGFVKQAKKEAKNTSAPPRDDNDMPHPHKTHPLPESWEGIPIPPPLQTDNTQNGQHSNKRTSTQAKGRTFYPPKLSNSTNCATQAISCTNTTNQQSRNPRYLSRHRYTIGRRNTQGYHLVGNITEEILRNDHLVGNITEEILRNEKLKKQYIKVK